MLKGYKFNQPYRKILSKSIYEQEYRLVEDFLASEQKNIRLEYDCVRSAVNASVAIRKNVAEYRQPLNVMQRENYVFVVRRGEEK